MPAQKEGIQKTKWKFLMAFAIKRRTPRPLNGTNLHPLFCPTFFLLQLNLTYTTYKRILHLVPVKIVTLKSSYN